MSIRDRIENTLHVMFPPCGYFESSDGGTEREREAERRGHEAARKVVHKDELQQYMNRLRNCAREWGAATTNGMPEHAARAKRDTFDAERELREYVEGLGRELT